MKVINLFAGPGSGKSTTAAGLFYHLKTMNKKVEYVSEYAKDLIYENRFERLNDYLYMLAKQHHRLYRLKGKVDYVICDGSFLFSYIHYSKNSMYNKKLFKQLILSIFNQYDNTNYFLDRQDIKYQTYGRKENFKKARELDKKLLKLFKDKKITYKKISSKNAVKNILKDIL